MFTSGVIDVADGLLVIAMDRLNLDWQVKEPMTPVPMKLVLVTPAGLSIG
jgi:hypothetical protein